MSGPPAAPWPWDVLAHGDAVAQGAAWTSWLPAVVVGVGGTSLVLLALRRVRATGRRPRPWRSAALVAGLLLLAAGLAPPLAQAAHEDLRGHMVQHLVVGMYAPLLLALGGPVSLLLAATGRGVRRVVGRVVRSGWLRAAGHPVTAATLSVGGLYALYLGDLYARSAESPLVHSAVHVHLVLSGYLLAWSLAGTDPAPHRPRLAVRLVVLVLAGAAHNHLAKLLYARSTELPAGAHVPADVVEEAARWMYYGGDLAELGLAVAVLAGWYRAGSHELRRVPVAARRGAGPDPASP